jgi:hypothetical protein
MFLIRGTTMGRTLVLAVIALLWAPTLHAGLAEGEETVTRDQSQLNCKLHEITDLGSYKLHILHRDDGSIINEYVGAGKIFAVTWSGGRNHPDLSNLLGLHYKEYQAANPLVPSHARGTGARGRTGNGRRVVPTENIVVETGGHLGSVQGRAWVAKLIPARVNLSDIK